MPGITLDPSGRQSLIGHTGTPGLFFGKEYSDERTEKKGQARCTGRLPKHGGTVPVIWTEP